MSNAPESDRWASLSTLEWPDEAGESSAELRRIWLGFMTARVALGALLSALQAYVQLLAAGAASFTLTLCLCYWVLAWLVRWRCQPRPLGTRLDWHWLNTVGLDVLTFLALQILPNNAFNTAPLLALPVLMAAVLGSMRLAMSVSAGITLVLFTHSAWLSSQLTLDSSSLFLQSALTGAGCFATAFLASQMASRLQKLESKAHQHQLAELVQREVNALVIESLPEGVLVADRQGRIHLANPAAQRLLTSQDNLAELRWVHSSELLQFIEHSFLYGKGLKADIELKNNPDGVRRLRLRTQLTAVPDQRLGGLCVVFLQDQREIQARIRAEKLAGMGRMSAAVAHEIRNPLAAIAQANALLAEDQLTPVQQRLSSIVQQNTTRLEGMVRDILQLTHTPTHESPPSLVLVKSMSQIIQDWCAQHGIAPLPLMHSEEQAHLQVLFDDEHLRRVVVNLLDNAWRHVQQIPDAIDLQLDTQREHNRVLLRVWSAGDALEPSVERHLFEPFFSSQSRSSGLGLYICRSLCDTHGALLNYERSARPGADGSSRMGNEFNISFAKA